ncbi:hypothetical protein N7478_000592 [Penicillium angulare]|uniref:uncharacterized protein n=1 Tax=Penicillium angulare TaxID=116970 RepID=UPI0025410B35|nr:uncharacterized protein N7478_000592 [Penicillium angulare]KAJ5291341.1 hypothetical protein N7478_000592 [Penicillium angulare]
MPAPLAKGIILTVSVLVAAGVAVYQSPQFQEWMNTSRRKVAVALHNLGDEIQPRNSSSPTREDISMNEDIGEAAEERRRIARAEIERRAALLETRRNSRNSQQPLDSFDSLVDNDGNLRLHNRMNRNLSDDNNMASSTAVDIGTSQQLWRGRLTDLDGNRLQVEIHSDTASHHPSESIVQYTPTSENPHGGSLFDPFSDSRGHSPVSAASISASSHTEGNEPVYYTHPHSASDSSHRPDTFHDLNELINWDQEERQVSSAPSIAGSSINGHRFNDVSSDGTLSDLGAASVGGVSTPASWSEIGSVVSDNDAGHQQLL